MKKLRRIDSHESSSEIESSIELKEGMEVEHARFGSGVVERIEGDRNNKKAVIAFQGFGKKNLLLRFAKLKIK